MNKINFLFFIVFLLFLYILYLQNIINTDSVKSTSNISTMPTYFSSIENRLIALETITNRLEVDMNNLNYKRHKAKGLTLQSNQEELYTALRTDIDGLRSIIQSLSNYKQKAVLDHNKTQKTVNTSDEVEQRMSNVDYFLELDTMIEERKNTGITQDIEDQVRQKIEEYKLKNMDLKLVQCSDQYCKMTFDESDTFNSRLFVRKSSSFFPHKKYDIKFSAQNNGDMHVYVSMENNRLPGFEEKGSDELQKIFNSIK